MKRITFILVAFLFIANACGPSVEGETKAWKANLKSVETAKATYPQFAKTIEQKLSQAKALWEEAKGISEEEAKAEKMEAANSLLSGGCVGNLISMKSKISSVKSSIERVERLRKGKKGESKRYAEDAIEDAEKAVKKAKKALKGDSCEDILEAYRKLSSADSDLSTAVTKLNNSEKKKKDKNKDKEKLDDSNTNTTNNTDKVKEVKMVKCPYCGTKNDATNDKCKSCGAQL